MWYVLRLFDVLLKKVFLGLELAHLSRSVHCFESPLLVLAREESITQLVFFTALAGAAGEVSLWFIKF
jgi:hypothetical protein